jgi:hypothetical protein
MAFVHGKNTVITLSGLSGPASGSHDLSIYINTSKWNFGADSHDTTTYGKNDHVFAAGLKVGTFTMGGVYDGTNPSTNTPWFVLSQATGSTCTIALKPEGTGTGKPTHTFTAVLTDYSQTAPVADMISWDSSFTVSDAVTTTIQ